ncbi:hypothetical protein N7490_009721 [Penicillium lividum]|nr:hypothetical protein N7490_009721 [Penicillium lividum]
MATPYEITIDNLNGNWVLNKSLSSAMDPIFKLQGIRWILRKAIALTDIRLTISTSHILGPPSDKPITTIEFLQTPFVGNLASTREKRTLDWEARHHSDYFFGEAMCWSRFLRASSSTEEDGAVRPEFEMQTRPLNTHIKQFLRGEVSPDGDEGKACTTPGGFLVEEPQGGQAQNQDRGLWVHTYERSVKSGWEVEQVWGFEMINEKRYFTRRLAVKDTEERNICGRFVYDFAD